MVEKIKTIAKYVVNCLAIINALLLGLNPIWTIPYTTEISQTIIVIIGVLGTYLLGTKVVNEITQGKE